MTRMSDKSNAMASKIKETTPKQKLSSNRSPKNVTVKNKNGGFSSGTFGISSWDHRKPFSKPQTGFTPAQKQSSDSVA